MYIEKGVVFAGGFLPHWELLVLMDMSKFGLVIKCCMFRV